MMNLSYQGCFLYLVSKIIGNIAYCAITLTRAKVEIVDLQLDKVTSNSK